MRPVVSCQDELISWIEGDPSPNSVRPIVLAVAEKIVLRGPLSKRELYKYLSVLSNETSQNLLISLIESLVLIQSTSSSRLMEYELTDLPDPTFPEIALSDQLHNAIRFHSRTMQVGESRSEGFNRLFGHLLAEATTVEIVDRFFAEKVAGGEEVTTWVLRQISNHTSCPIRVSSAIPRPSQKSNLSSERFKNVEETVRALLAVKLSLNLPNSIHLDLFERAPHNRYIRVQFSGGALYCSIDHGVDAFKDDPLSEPEPVTEISKEAFADISRSTSWRPTSRDDLCTYQPPRLVSNEEIHIRVPRQLRQIRAA